jgi:hypothetical protein
MPNHLEHVVRPSQSPIIRPGHRSQLLEAPKIVQNNPQVWGSAGNSVFQLHAHAQQELPQPLTEKERTYDVVRVFNPDDHEQYVDTEQMTEYQGRNKISNDRITLRFNGSTPSEHTKVISKNQKRKQDD